MLIDLVDAALSVEDEAQFAAWHERADQRTSRLLRKSHAGA
jgi:hypothetical protein